MNAWIYAIPLFTSGALCIALALVILQRRETRGIGYYTALLFAVAEWTLFSGISYLAKTQSQQIFLVNFQFIGITLVPVTWFMFVLTYTGRHNKIKRSRLWMLAIQPLLLNLVVWTDPYHHLFRSRIIFDTSAVVPYIQTEMGPLFWLHVIYTYGLLAISTFWLWVTYTKSRGVYRKQAWLLSLGAVAPWISNIIFIFDVFPTLILDPTPFAFTATALMAFIALQRYGLFELIPVAREMVIELLRDPVFLLDMHDRILDANPAAQQVFSIEVESLIGQHIVELIPSYPLLVSQNGDDLPTLIPLRMSGHNAPFTYEVRLQYLDDGQQAYSGGILVLHDVTSEQRARETLGSYAERLRVLHNIDQSILSEEQPDNIARAGLLGLQHILEYSAGLVLTRDDVDGYDFLAMANSRGRDVDLEGWLRAMRDTPLSAGLPLRKQDLSRESVTSALDKYLFSRGVRGYLVIPMLMTGEMMGAMAFEFDSPNAFSNEQLDAALQVTVSLAVTLHNANLRLSLKYELAVRQRTEAALRNSEAALRTYAAELEAQNAELDAFAHTVAHDIKQPLAQLIGYSSLLEAEYTSLPEDTLLLCVNAIAGSSRKMSSITEELLLLASVRKLEEVDVQPVRMEEVIPEVLQRLERLILQSEARIKVPENWPTVVAYAPWIEEVWANYVSNALKYGGKPPEVELGWNLEPAQGDRHTASVRFWVRDKGKGLTAGEQARLFVPFERLEQVRAQGHGLGLSIVQRIITKMGGQVGVESSGVPGDGSLFYFCLPAP